MDMEKITNNTEQRSFNGLGISPNFLSALQKLNFTTPTPIQYRAIPSAIEGKDIVGIAQTGTGKTLAFGIPMIQRIIALEGKNRGLILLPTRELAIQVNNTLQKITRGFGVRTAVLIGGESMYHQIRAIKNNPHVIIGTPGRINDHLKQRTINFNTISILVLDEADKMFDMGFADQIKQILAVTPKERQTMLFSATMPDTILKIANQYMKLPLRIEIAKSGTTAEKVEHELFVVQKDQKMTLLQKLLIEYKGSVLIFSRTKYGVKKICSNLRGMNFSAEEIHSNRSLTQRKKALDGFRSGRYRVLVATDIASRGIDVKGIELVLNYDLPESAEDYVHRIGRTGRAGLAGKAISFVAPDQKNKIREIEYLIRTSIPISKAQGIVPVSLKQNYQPKYNHTQYIRSKKNFRSEKRYNRSR